MNQAQDMVFRKLIGYTEVRVLSSFVFLFFLEFFWCVGGMGEVMGSDLGKDQYSPSTVNPSLEQGWSRRAVWKLLPSLQGPPSKQKGG